MRASHLVLLVVLCSAILSIGIGLGLYFGLRPRVPEPASAPAMRDPGAAADQVIAALERERPRLQRTCARPEDPPRQLILSLAFDAEGRQIGLGLIDDRNHPSPEQARCLEEQLGLSLRIPPPGQPVSLQVPLVFPRPG